MKIINSKLSIKSNSNYDISRLNISKDGSLQQSPCDINGFQCLIVSENFDVLSIDRRSYNLKIYTRTRTNDCIIILMFCSNNLSSTRRFKKIRKLIISSAFQHQFFLIYTKIPNTVMES